MKTYLHITSNWIIGGMRNISDKRWIKKTKTQFHIQYSFAENHVICKKIWETTVQPDRPQ